MALSKVDFNNINVTPAASKALKWNASANGFETGDLGGNMVLLSTQTASSSSTISFTSGIDSTYKEYIFKFIDIHPSENEKNFQVTGIQIIGNAIGNANDESGAGTMHLFDPSNTTFVKHYIMRSNSYNGSDYSIDTFVAGYCNTTSAIDGVQFSFASGNIDAGTIKMYGIL